MQEQAQVWALREFFLLLVLALALLCCTSELGQCKHKHKRNGSISCQRTKKTNGSSPTLTDTQDGNRIWRETLCLCKSLCLCLSHLCECPCAVIYACTYACLFACLLAYVISGGKWRHIRCEWNICAYRWDSVRISVPETKRSMHHPQVYWRKIGLYFRSCNSIYKSHFEFHVRAVASKKCT